MRVWLHSPVYACVKARGWLVGAFLSHSPFLLLQVYHHYCACVTAHAMHVEVGWQPTDSSLSCYVIDFLLFLLMHYLCNFIQLWFGGIKLWLSGLCDKCFKPLSHPVALHIMLWDGYSSVNLKLTILARLTGQWAPGILLSLPFLELALQVCWLVCWCWAPDLGPFVCSARTARWAIFTGTIKKSYHFIYVATLPDEHVFYKEHRQETGCPRRDVLVPRGQTKATRLTVGW